VHSGILAEFDGPEPFERAFVRLTGLGYTQLESWTPYPVRGVVARLPESPVPWIMLVAGLGGAGLGYLFEWACNAYSYPIDVGGRPLDSVPAFIPIAFESGVLAASVAGFLAIVGLSGLPRLHHPLFEVPGFERASVDRFWIGVDQSDPRFDGRVQGELEGLGALRCERIGDDR
jgi:ActD protein